MPRTCSRRCCCWPWPSNGSRSRESSRWWWILTAVVPVLLALSYPAVFVAGGISLALAAPGAEARPPCRPAGASLAYNLVLAGSFLAIFLACTITQAAEMGGFYRTGILGRVVPAPGSSVDACLSGCWTCTRA